MYIYIFTLVFIYMHIHIHVKYMHVKLHTPSLTVHSKFQVLPLSLRGQQMLFPTPWKIIWYFHLNVRSLVFMWILVW